MGDPDPILIFVHALNGIGVRYMVTGSVASIAYGQPRLTHDVDIVIELVRAQIEGLVAAFPLGAYYCPPAEVIRLENARQRRGHFNIIHHQTGFKADMYLVGDDPLHAWALARVRRIDMSGETVPLAPPEYVILRKLEFYEEGGSEKHLLDIRAMLETSAAIIDMPVLDELIASRRLNEEWRRVTQGLAS